MTSTTRLGLAFAASMLALAACSERSAPPSSSPGVQQSTATAAAVKAPEPPVPSPPPPPLPDPLAIGSPEARDDLYCSGVLIAAFPTPMDAQVPVEQARIERGQTNAIILGETGVQKLIKEGVIVSAQASQVLDAWADRAGKDFDSGKPRLSQETCSARAEAITPDQ